MTDRPTWDETWMAMAVQLGKRSRCSRGKIGAVIVSADNRVLSASYVGPAKNYAPANRDLSTDCTAWCPRAQPGAATDPSYANCVSCHAEQNAVARCDESPQGGTIYVNGSICVNCAKLVAAAGMAKVVMIVYAADAHRNPEAVVKFLIDAGVAVEVRHE